MPGFRASSYDLCVVTAVEYRGHVAPSGIDPKIALEVRAIAMRKTHPNSVSEFKVEVT
jgi:hypothetical protein